MSALVIVNFVSLRAVLPPCAVVAAQAHNRRNILQSQNSKGGAGFAPLTLSGSGVLTPRRWVVLWAFAFSIGCISLQNFNSGGHYVYCIG